MRTELNYKKQKARRKSFATSIKMTVTKEKGVEIEKPEKATTSFSSPAPAPFHRAEAISTNQNKVETTPEIEENWSDEKFEEWLDENSLKFLFPVLQQHKILYPAIKFITMDDLVKYCNVDVGDARLLITARDRKFVAYTLKEEAYRKLQATITQLDGLVKALVVGNLK